MTKVFIGNLSDDAKGHHVEDFFSKFGTLREITLKNGFGFVEFEDRRDAEDACGELNGQRLAGEKVVVELAGRDNGRSRQQQHSRSRSRERGGGRDSYWDDRGHRGSGGGGGRFGGGGDRGGGGGRPHRTQWALTLDNLSSRCSWAELKDHCRKFGEVTYTDAHFRSGEGKGEVCFAERGDMERALDELDGQEIMGKAVRVSKSRDSTGDDYNNRSRHSRRRSRSRSRDRGGRGGGGGGRRDRPHRTAYTIGVDSLSSRCDWSQLKDIMRRVGEVTYVDAHNRMGRGRGECCFATREIMMKAKDELDGFEINGKRIQLYIKENGSRSPSPNRNGGGGGGGDRYSRSRSRSRSGSRGRYR